MSEEEASHGLKYLDASAIIIGFTGPIGSGCTFIAKGLCDEHPTYRYYKLSEIILESLASKGITSPTIDQKQNEGNELRLTNKKNSYLVKKLIEKIDSEAKEHNGEEFNVILIDGIKNEAEIKLLRSFPNFFLLSVHASEEVRCHRCIQPKPVKRFKNKTEFCKADKRDKEEEYEYGQQVKRCSDLSDIILINNDDIASASRSKKSAFIQKIYSQYIKVIENLKEGRDTPDRAPSVDEYCMAMAYTVSKCSSCMKRKVGAIIIDTCCPSLKDFDEQDASSNKYPLPQVVAAGYNEVPVGSVPCRYYPPIEECYRDYLQEIQAKKIKYCPNCGEKIKLTLKCHCGATISKYLKICSTCGSEINDTFKCFKCRKAVFKEYLPGGKDSPGKLLDLCRALHAEENALLSLINSGRKVLGDLVLFVTTQPCNQCANKIVSSNIKRVCFAEPYLMKESAETLRKGEVELKTFQGVKSSAFFKFYK